MPIVDLTEEEIRAQLVINDTALKAAGLQIAEAVVILSKKLQEAMKPRDDLPKSD